MRIVAGKFKGRSIRTPDGTSTRPTTDRVREAVFNILAHADWAPELEGARVMDVYAGSGALGFEAISRGAAFCLFVETASAARGIIRENVEGLSLFGITRIHRRSATDLGPKPASLGTPFELVLMDPPYGKGLVAPTLGNLRTGGWLTGQAVAVVETPNEEIPDAKGWTLIDSRVLGSSRVSFLTQAQDG